MRVGVVGLGRWGANHVRALSGARHVDSLVVHDALRSRAVEVAAGSPAIDVAGSAASLFEACDAVVIATHPSTHAQLASAALDAGCHVLVEKPMALAVRDAANMADLAATAGRVLMVGHTFVFHPAIRSLLQAVDSGALGEVRHVQSRRLSFGTYRSDCDVIWDLGPHDVSIVNEVMGGPPQAVRTWGSRAVHRSTDTAQLQLEYRGGVHATVSLSWCWPTKVRELTLVGTGGTVVFDDTDPVAPLRFYDSPVTAPRPSRAALAGRGSASGSDPRFEPLAIEDQHFLDCVVAGREPSTGVHHALGVMRTLEAATASLDEDRRVQLSEVPGPVRRHLPATAVALA